MRGKEGFELPLGVQSGGGKQSGVDAHSHLVHDTCRVGETVGGLKDGVGNPRGGQKVGHRGSSDQRAGGRVRQKGGLGRWVPSKVGVGAC